MKKTTVGTWLGALALLALAACGSKGGTGGTSSGAGGGSACVVMSQSCSDCVNAMCMTEETDCSDDVTCNRAQNTWGPCVCSAQTASDTASEDACTSAFSGADATAMAAAACIQQSCASECF